MARDDRYPSDYIDVLRLPGRDVVVRPARASDCELQRTFVRTLSAKSRHSRFMSAISELSDKMAREFCDIDYRTHFALIAMTGQGASETMIGEARYVVDAEGARACEFAISVADAWRGRGVGRELMRKIVRRARASGLSLMHGFTLAGNSSMIWLAMSLGFDLSQDALESDLVRMELALDGVSDFDRGSRLAVHNEPAFGAATRSQP